MEKATFAKQMLSPYRRRPTKWVPSVSTAYKRTFDGTVLMQPCTIPFSPVVWSVFIRRPSTSNSVLPEEQRLYRWVPEKVGDYQIIVRPLTLKPGDYRFEAKVRTQNIHC